MQLASLEISLWFLFFVGLRNFHDLSRASCFRLFSLNNPPKNADCYKAFYCMACVCSRYNARSDWLILGYYSPVMPSERKRSFIDDTWPLSLGWDALLTQMGMGQLNELRYGINSAALSKWMMFSILNRWLHIYPSRFTKDTWIPLEIQIMPGWKQQHCIFMMKLERYSVILNLRYGSEPLFKMPSLITILHSYGDTVLYGAGKSPHPHPPACVWKHKCFVADWKR